MMDYYSNGHQASNKYYQPVKSEYGEGDYIRWINHQLADLSPPLTISDLTEPNMCNGVAIGLLLETLGNLKLNGLLLQPGTRVERLHNVHEVFTMLRRLNVRLDNVQPEDMMIGDRETILQVLLALASHFTGQPRGGRHHVSSDYRHHSRAYSGGSSPRSSHRQTPSDRYGSSQSSTPSMVLPSEHYTEVTNAQYSHEIIGPNVYSENHSGKSSPRSRSSMTVNFSGQRSPTSQRRSGSRSSEGSETVSASDYRVPKPRSPRDRYGNRSSSMDNQTRTAAAAGQSSAELPHYLESMNELSNLKSQLNTISKLTSYGYDPQTDAKRDVYSDLTHAQQQIAELTRILHSKDQALRQKEKEISRLQETIRSLQEALYQQEASSHFSSSGRRAPSQSHPLPYNPQPSRRRSPDHTFMSDSHSHDPRVADPVRNNDQPKKRSRSRERMRQASPTRSSHGSSMARKAESYQ